MKKKSGKIIWVILLIISILVCILCSTFLIRYFFFDDSSYIERPTTISQAPTDTSETKEIEETKKESENEIPAKKYAEDTTKLKEGEAVSFEEMMEVNEDIYAWIYIPGTSVDYPVAQSAKGVDDSFYLTHNIYKNYQFSGTIYTEKANSRDFSDPVTVLYGHNMLNGSMFATLHNFNNVDFFSENNTIFVFTKDKTLTYLIYAAYQYDDRHILNSFDMSEPVNLRQYQESTLMKRPYYCNIRDGVELSTDDKIITLSTCMGGGGNTRYLVQGVLVNEEPTK